MAYDAMSSAAWPARSAPRSTGADDHGSRAGDVRSIRHPVKVTTASSAKSASGCE